MISKNVLRARMIVLASLGSVVGSRPCRRKRTRFQKPAKSHVHTEHEILIFLRF